MLKRAALVAAAAAAIGFGSYFARAEDKAPQSGTPVKTALPSPDAEGFIPMFNGKDLDGWHGLEGFWSVKDGMIVGADEKAKSELTFLVYTAMPTIANFEMHYNYRFPHTPDGNSGVQFRSKMLKPETSGVGGYQADCDAKARNDGSIYDEAGVAGGRFSLPFATASSSLEFVVTFAAGYSTHVACFTNGCSLACTTQA